MTRGQRGTVQCLLRTALLAAACAYTLSGACQTSTAPAADGVFLEVKRFAVEGDENPLPQAETDAILSKYLGVHRSLDTIEAAARSLEDAMRQKGFSFHRVIVPAQRPTGGVLVLRVLRFNLAQVTVSGNQHFSSENILRSLPSLEAGKSPDVGELAREVALANEHPAKRVSIQIKESQKGDHLDADVKVRDVPSSQTFIGLTGHTRDYNNTLNQNTGYTRLTIGHQQSNLFDRDHVGTIAYTTSPDHISDVTQVGAFYWMPLYGYHTTLNAYATYSDVNNGTIGTTGGSFNVTGKGQFWGARATYALPKFGLGTHAVSFAIDDRYFKSNVGFQGTGLPTNNVGSRPLSLRYAPRYEQTEGAIGGYIEYAHNVGGARYDDQISYTIARPGAQTNWNAYRYGIDANYAIAAGWMLTGRYRGQYANEPLIPGEQFGVGGFGTLRGLRDREMTGDKGNNLTIELQTPEFFGVSPFLFFDYGNVKYTSPVPVGMPTSDNAASAGFGMKWNWERKLEVSASLATVVNGVDVPKGTNSGFVKLDFSVFYRF